MKSSKPQFLIILFSLVILFIVWINYQKMNGNENSVSVEVNNTIETTAIDPNLILSDVNTYTTAADHTSSLPESASLDIPYISQYPELPTGCEVTALAQVLSFYGFDIDKESLARNHLPMKNIKEVGCYINYFYGSPWSEHGSGCFAPAITDTANSFLNSQGSSLLAHTISYSSVKSLLHEVSDGSPVLVWTSTDYDDKDVSYNEIDLGSNQTFSWPENEHCIVLSGYDLNTKTVTVVDPAQGVVTHNINDFTYFYQKYYYQAVVIK